MSASRTGARPSGVAGEVGRAAADLALLVPRAAAYLARRGRLLREARADLAAPALVTPAPPARFPDRRLEVFVSCAEASGEIHARGLVRELARLAREQGAPEPRFRGLGGPALAELGVELVGDPVSRAAMGFDVVSALPFYLGLLSDAAASLDAEPADLLLPVDSPALHVPLARLARARGVPVVHFVTPQLWGWAPWRVGAYRRAVDLALTILPFEAPWFERHGVPCAHVGHPLLDALGGVPPGPHAAGEARGAPFACLPGSRRSVVRRNLPWMLSVLGQVRSATGEPDVLVPVPAGDAADEAAAVVAEAGAGAWARVERDGLHPALSRSRAAFSVSGTVLVDVLHHRLPAVVCYRLANARQGLLRRWFLTVPWFSSPNLLAGREVLPELAFHGAGPTEAVGEALVRCYNDPTWREECRAGLELAARRLGPPGAVERAARHALATAVAPEPHARAQPPEPGRPPGPDPHPGPSGRSPAR